MEKKEVKIIEEKLIELTGRFCAQYLNDEYSQLCERLIRKMGRKHNVPFSRGKVEIWAAAVVHAIGSINFLFDKSSKPYVNSTQISAYFETKNPTVSNKARQIKEMFDLTIYDDNFSTKELKENNPFDNLIVVDGFIVQLSSLPLNMQEWVKKNRLEGIETEFTTMTSEE